MSALSDAVDALESATNDDLAPAVDAAVEALTDVSTQVGRVGAVTQTVADSAAALNNAVNPPATTAARRVRR
jgi:hypothetical protein